MKNITHFAALVLIGVSALATTIEPPTKIYCRIHQTDAFYQKTTNPNTPRCTYYFSHGYGEKEHTIVTACS